MKADNPICYVVDGVFYLLLFVLLVAVLRLAFYFIARNEAEYGTGKALAATTLVLLSVAAMLQYAAQLGVFLPIVCVLLAFGALRLVCGAPYLSPHERGLIWEPVFDVPEEAVTDVIRRP
jgi:hypothetical protein